MVNLVTAQELGKYLKLSDSTIYKLALHGELPGFKIGDSWRFDMEDVIDHVRAKKAVVGAGSAPTRKNRDKEKRG